MKPGDKVRCIDAEGSLGFLEVGETYTVEVGSASFIELEETDTVWWPRRFEVVEDGERESYMRGFNDAYQVISDAACEAFMAGEDDEADALRAVCDRIEANYEAPRPGRPE